MTLTSFANRPAWQIQSEQLRVTVMQCGGHVAETTFLPTGINPLWMQDRPTIDADEFDPAIHGAIYGNDGEAKLISGLLGHNLCLPYWGLPSPAELRQGMTCHGEPNATRWQAKFHGHDRLELEVTLPASALYVERNIRCAGPIVYFETTVENLLSLDRPIAWCEHVTVGPPFLGDHTGFWANLGKGYQTSGDIDRSFLWPQGRGQIDCDLSRFSALLHADLVNSFLVTAENGYGCFAAWNAPLGSVFGYVFSADQFPWVNVWENRDERRHTRGMEFSTTPIEGSLKQLFANPRVFERATFEWLDARGRLRKQFFSFTLPVPSSFKGVASTRFDGKVLELFELESRVPLTLILRTHA